MDADISRNLLGIVARAERLAPERRERFLIEQLGNDDGALDQARRLLALFAEETCMPQDGESGEVAALLPQIPGFELIELIGHGGMGSVFRARQLKPDREVAIKLIRADLLSEDARQRLEREADLLGRLDHPAIARVHAAGHSVTGPGPDQPWLAMELIGGVTLKEHLAEEHPDDHAILRLVAQIAEGVQYAHQQGIIHRDLKPANILIDDQGRPRILDFGVARFTEIDPAQASTILKPGELVGTLGYMAPEQLDGKADTRSDVYALGVMLYQALGGSMPLDLGSLSLLDALGRLAREDPVPLRRHRPDLSPELESVVMHALERDPARRYASAAQLLEDIERYLDHRPVLARPPGRWRNAMLFVRRHRVGFAVASVLALTVLAGVVVSVHFGYREAQARAEAELRSDQLAAVNRFIHDMLIAADPDNTLGEQVTLVETLEQAARLLVFDEGMAAPVRAELHRVIGTTMLNLGQVEAGRDQLEMAVDLHARLGQTTSSEGQRARLELARARLEKGETDAALNLVEAVEAELENVAPGHLLRIQAMAVHGRALIEAGRYELAQERVEARLSEAEQYLGSGHMETLVLRNLLAVVAGRMGNPQREAEIQERILTDRLALFGSDHPQTLSAMNNLASALSQAGDPARAELLLRDVLAARVRVLGEDHPSTTITRSNFAAQLISNGKLEEAEPEARRVLDAHSQRLGPVHHNTLTAKNILAFLLEDQGNLAEAETLYREIIEAVAGADDDGLSTQLLAVGNNLAMLLMTRGDLASAEAEFLRLLPEAERLLGRSHLMYAIFAGNYGRCLNQLERHDQAVSVLGESLDILEASLGPTHARSVQVRDWLTSAQQGVNPET